MITFVGESNPYGADPSFALYPLPERASGGMLCVRLGLQPRAYLRDFSRVNLLQLGPDCPRWSVPKAREAARAMIEAASPATSFVLLGAKVATAFGMDVEPWGTIRAGVLGAIGSKCLKLPHPSGLCRVWNDPGFVDRMRRAFAEFQAIAAWGQKP